MDKKESIKVRKALAFQDLTEEEKAKRHILGRLYGPIADVVRPTRNGRRYSEELWEKVFQNPIMKEKFANKVMYGELGHPEDRDEIDMTKAAVCMPEPPKKDDQGRLIGYFDILDTPNGRILKTLVDYGSCLGVSSRGTGDVVEGIDGESEVDPDTYDCECWDIVTVPAVESARLSFTEGLSKKKGLSLTEALSKQIESASGQDREIMEEAVKSLGIAQGDEKHGEEKNEKESPEAHSEGVPADGPEAKGDKNECNEGDGLRADTGANREIEAGLPEGLEATDGGTGMEDSLKEALKSVSDKDREIKELKEKAAVGDAKVSKLVEESARQKKALARLSSIARKSKELERSVCGLKERLKAKNARIRFLDSKVANLVKEANGRDSVHEALAKRESDVSSLRKRLESLDRENSELRSKIAEAKAPQKEAGNLLEERIRKAERTAEGYKRLATNVTERYVEAKARSMGLDPHAVMRRLPESYGLDDIDEACNGLADYRRRVGKLSFVIGDDSTIAIRESNKSRLVSANLNSEQADDDIDEATMNLANSAINKAS